MYKGTLIDELMATVERVEKQPHVQADVAELERWFAAPYQVAQVEPTLLGVA